MTFEYFNYDNPRVIVPMKAATGKLEMLNHPVMCYQYKYNGSRCICIRNGSDVKLMSRTWKNDLSDAYPLIVQEILKFPARKFVIDGELVFFNRETGKDEYLTSLAKPETAAKYDLYYVVFDVLWFGDLDLRERSLVVRIGWLKHIVPHGLSRVLVAPLFHGQGVGLRFYNFTSARGTEGLMVKDMASSYVEDSRSGGWYKIKFHDNSDCIAVGYSQGLGKRAETFGAMLLAQYNQVGNLVYVGKCSGFTDEQLVEFKARLDALRVEMPPVINDHAAPVKIWSKPEIVVEIKHFRWTEDNKMISPEFVRERDDKSPEDCLLGNGMT